MTQVVVSAQTESWTTRRADPDDSWDIGDEDGRVTNVVALLSDTEHNYYGDSHGKDIPDAKIGDTIYAVVADYTSGCTFGRSGGHAQVVDFFTDPEEAAELAAKCISGGYDGYQAWTGYFESLNSLDVWDIQIKRNMFSTNREDGYGFKRGT